MSPVAMPSHTPIVNGISPKLNGASSFPQTNGHAHPNPNGTATHRFPGLPILNPNPPTRTSFAFDPISEAIQAFKNGEFIVVVDDENRENEGDLIIAAKECTTEKMAWLVRNSSGYICIPLPGERLDELDIPMMYPQNQERYKTAYAVTVDYKHGTTTGISAHDRSLTARSLVSPSPTITSTSFTRPGHMVPLRAQAGGVLTRRGHTEAALDLCLLAGIPEKERGGVLCEIVDNDDVEGGMLRRDGCRKFCDRWGLKLISIDMLVEVRRNMENGD